MVDVSAAIIESNFKGKIISSFAGELNQRISMQSTRI